MGSESREGDALDGCERLSSQQAWVENLCTFRESNSRYLGFTAPTLVATPAELSQLPWGNKYDC
jgi:hypothetical protein